MPITYTIDREQTLINEVWTGEIQAQDLAEYWTQYLRDPEVMTIRRTLVDLRNASILFRGSDLDRLIDHPYRGPLVFPPDEFLFRLGREVKKFNLFDSREGGQQLAFGDV